MLYFLHPNIYVYYVILYETHNNNILVSNYIYVYVLTTTVICNPSSLYNYTLNGSIFFFFLLLSTAKMFKRFPFSVFCFRKSGSSLL